MLFSQEKEPEFMLPLLWPPNSPDSNPVDYSVWRNTAKQGVQNMHDSYRRPQAPYKNSGLSWITPAIVAASVHQWCRCLSVSVKAGDGHFKHCFWFRHCVFSNKVLQPFLLPLTSQTPARKQLGHRPISFNCSCQLWHCALQYTAIV